MPRCNPLHDEDTSGHGYCLTTRPQYLGSWVAHKHPELPTGTQRIEVTPTLIKLAILHVKMSSPLSWCPTPYKGEEDHVCILFPFKHGLFKDKIAYEGVECLDLP